MTNRAGTRTKRATPSQNNEKSRAVPRAKRTVEAMKTVKIRSGVKEKRRCVKTKDCDVLVLSLQCRNRKQINDREFKQLIPSYETEKLKKQNSRGSGRRRESDGHTASSGRSFAKPAMAEYVIRRASGLTTRSTSLCTSPSNPDALRDTDPLTVLYDIAIGLVYRRDTVLMNRMDGKLEELLIRDGRSGVLAAG